jgi:hypothetical protein
MNAYLDQLIKSVEAEAAEERIHLKEQERYPSKSAGGGLRRALQRLEVLRSLRNAERGASASH